MSKLKVIFLFFPFLCFSMTFEESFSLTVGYYQNLFSSNGEKKFLFSKDYKKEFDEGFIECEEVLLLFFPENCGFNLLVEDQSGFENTQEVIDYVRQSGFEIVHFQFISDIPSFKNIHEIGDFYKKHLSKKIDPILLENSFFYQSDDFFFPIKFCLLKLKKR